jgi:hypothetical protein
MRNRSRLILTALAATALLSLAAGTTSARKFSIGDKSFDITWNAALGGLKTDLRWEDAGGNRVACRVTLSGSFHSNTIVKRLGTRIGVIHRALIPGCTTGSAAFLTETLPWDVQYEGFSGGLPTTITGIFIGIARFSLRTQIGITSCLTHTEAAQPFVGIINRFAMNTMENVRAEESEFIGLELPCVSPAIISGTALLRDSSGNQPRIRLI